MISVISLGGTIAMTQGGGAGVVPTLSSAALVGAVPQLAEVAEIEAVSFRQVPGAHLSIEDIVLLSREIARRIEAGAGGVVVTQGTDTIEETAYALDLLVSGETPIVVTGAMRNPTLPGADGPANLLAAVQVAASDEAKGLGTLVVANDEIHAARFVKKLHTTSTATFQSPLLGPVGWVIEGRTRIAARVPRRPCITDIKEGEKSAVALMKITLGDDGRLLRYVEQAGYAGLVVETFGGGHVPATMVEKLAELAGIMPVVLASRTGTGEMLRRTYGFPGSETDLLGKGLISAGTLDGPKVRILLTLLLWTGLTRGEIASRFDEWTGV